MCAVVADFVLVYTVLCRDVACRMECSRLRAGDQFWRPFIGSAFTILSAVFPRQARRKEMSTVCQCNKEKKRNTHPRVREAFYNIAPLLSYLRNAEFSPLPSIRRLNREAEFGAWRLNLAFSPRVKVAKSRRRAGGAWVVLWRAFPQTQELVFFAYFSTSYLTSGTFSCCYFLLLKQRIF